MQGRLLRQRQSKSGMAFRKWNLDRMEEDHQRASGPRRYQKRGYNGPVKNVYLQRSGIPCPSTRKINRRNDKQTLLHRHGRDYGSFQVGDFVAAPFVILGSTPVMIAV